MLADFQRQFTDILISNNNDITRDISPRMAIYRNNVQQSLRNLLSNIYRRCHIILGNDNFMYLAQEFVPAYLPNQASLYKYGGEFVDFLNQHAHVAKDYPWIGDLATIEWAYHQAFFVADLPNANLSSQDHQHIDPEILLHQPLKLHDSLWLNSSISEIAIDAMTMMRYDSDSNIDDMQLCDENKPYCDYAHQSIEQIFPIMVARGHILGIFHRTLTQPSYVFLNAIRTEKSLFQAIAHTEKHHQDWQYQAIVNLLIQEQLITFGEEK